MLKTIAIAVAVVIAAVLLYAATRPDDFLIERSVSIKAAPEKDISLHERFPQRGPLVAL